MTGQRTTEINGIQIELTPLKRDTLKNREREAVRRAKDIIKLLN